MEMGPAPLQTKIIGRDELQNRRVAVIDDEHCLACFVLCSVCRRRDQKGITLSLAMLLVLGT